MNNLKKILAVILFVFSAIAASAQKYGYADDRFRDNWFISGALGINAASINIGHFNSPAGLALDANVGKWFSPMFGARLGWQGLNFSTQDNKLGYNFIHGDIMWNFINTVDGLKDNRIWTLAPYASMGLVLNTKEGNLFTKGFGAGLGLYNGFRITNRLDIYLDLKAIAQSERSIGHPAGKLAMFSALAGIQYNIGRIGWDKVVGTPDPERPLNNRFWEDWFLYAAGGLHTVTSPRHWNGSFNTTSEIGLGKWFSPYAGARLAIQGSRFKAPETATLYNYAYLHADLLWNLSNTICRRKGTHVYTAAPYAHFGLYNSFGTSGDRFKSEFATGVGLYNSFAVNENIDLFADMRVAVTNGRIAKRAGGMIMEPSMMFGLAYNFNERRLLYTKYKEDDTIQHTGELENNGFGGNWSIYLAGGVNGLNLNIIHPSGIAYRPSFDFGFMKMFSPSFGARAGIQGNSIATSKFKKRWEYFHGDILWDIRGTAKGFDEDRIWSIAPYISMGVSFMHNYGTNVKFAGGAGLLNNWKVSNKLGLFVDLRGIIIPESQFGSVGGFAAEGSAMFGLAVDISKNRWDNRGNGTLLNKFGDNWFINSTGGFNLMWDSRSSFNGRPGAAMELAIGKWFSPEWGSRLGIMYGNMFKTDGNKYEAGYIHGDLLWNFSQTVAGYNPYRIYSAIPYLHFGLIGSWHNSGEYMGKDFTTGIGLINEFKVDDKMSFILDLRGRAMHGKLTGKAGGKAVAGEALFGISYTMGDGGWRPHHRDEDLRGPLSISTNLVSWADLATINLGLEYAFSRHWSFDIATEFNDWSFKGGDLCDKKRSVTVGFRYWPWYAYSGAWVRPFLGSETHSTTGMPIKFLNGTSDRFGAGFSAGYSLMVSKHLNIDFGLGFWGGMSHEFKGSWGGFIAPKDIRISLMFVL